MYTPHLLHWLTLLLFLTTSSVVGQNISRMQELLQQVPPSVTTSAMVYDLTADSCLLDHHSHLMLRPASTMKLLTAFSALTYLSPDVPFTTAVRSTGLPQAGVLRSPLYFTGMMDPLFSSQDLGTLLQALKDKGIDTLRTTIYLDESATDTTHWQKGWCWDDENPYLRPLLCNGSPKFDTYLKTLLPQYGIVFEGNIEKGSCPANNYLWAKVSHSVEEVLQPALKKSHNLSAEALLFRISMRNQHTATPTESLAAEKSLLTQWGINPQEYHLTDGSGLSLYNYLSTYILTDLLRKAYSNEILFNTLLNALPIAATDGTLKKRMHHTTAEGRIFAKTGTVFGVSALAGYALHPNGHWLCFAFIEQGIAQQRSAKAFEDQLCVALTE